MVVTRQSRPQRLPLPSSRPWTQSTTFETKETGIKHSSRGASEAVISVATSAPSTQRTERQPVSLGCLVQRFIVPEAGY